jgi:hypothetical protein
MIKRIAILFTLTGAAYAFSVLVLKRLASHPEIDQVAKIAELDTLVQFLIGLIGFGMQTEAIRNISFSTNWKKDLVEAQTARETFGFILLIVVAAGLIKEYYFYFAIAPLLAASADYALYARGLATVGAVIAFLRVTFPLGMALAAAFYFPHHLFVVYITSTALVYVFSNILIYHTLGLPFQYRVALGSIRMYLKTIPIGIINLAFYFFGLGILLLAQPFFDANQLVVSFVGLKFYLIFKGGIRVVHQGFVNKMNEEQVCIRIDKIAIMLAVLFFGTLSIFPNTIIPLVFGEQFLNHYFLFAGLGVAAVIFSIFSSSSTRIFLERRDLELMKIAMVSVLISVLSFLVAYYVISKPEVVVVALLIGELFFSIALSLKFFSVEQINQRLLFLAAALLSLLLPIGFKFFLGDSLIVYLTSFTVLAVMMFLVNRKQLTLPSPV